MPFPKEILQLGGVELITFTTVEGILYGFAFALYLSCARSLYLQLQDRDQRKRSLFTLVYTSIIMALALFEVAIDSQDMRVSFVDHGDYPDTGGFGYNADVFSNTPLVFAGYFVGLPLQVMLAGVQLWRLWIVCSHSRYTLLIVVLPALSFLLYIGFQITGIVTSVRPEVTPHIQILEFGTIISQLVLSVTVTIPIIIRILIVRRRNMEIMGQDGNMNSPYTTVIAMIIESFALECIWTIILVPAVSTSSFPVSVFRIFFADSFWYIQIIAYLLIVYRVTTGRGWKEDTAAKLTTLEWNRNEPLTTQTRTRASIPIAREEV